MFTDPTAFDAWADGWRPLVTARARRLNPVNPVYIPRNHLVDEALTAATADDPLPLAPAAGRPRAPVRGARGLEAYAHPAPDGGTGVHHTFCGT